MSVGIVGLGYVGLPIAIEFAKSGRQVIAYDTDAERVSSLSAGESYIEDIPSSELLACDSLLKATTNSGDLADAEAIIICVPTPLTINREPDLTPLKAAAKAVAQILKKGQLVVLESTTYPGTTRDLLLPILEGSQLKVPGDFNLAFSPERVDPGRTDYTIKTTPKVVGGVTQSCTERATALYGEICDEVVPVSSPESAELTKLLENIFRSINIALVNELAILAERMDIDIWEVVDAAASKPFGFMSFKPGPGMGGHCLPVDPFYLAWKAREYDLSTEFVELAGKINQRMPYFCVERIERALNEQGKPVKGSKIALLGVSYKPGVGDIRESPALKIISELLRQGAQLRYHDSYVPKLETFGLSSLSLEEALDGVDAVVIVTNHPDVDFTAVVQRADLLIDLRGVTKEIDSDRITRL